MATLPIIENIRGQLNAPGGAVTPRVNIPQVNPVGLEEAARYQGTLAQTLDRLSSRVFGIAENYAKEAGLQYAAENPLSQEQLQAIAQGDVTKVVSTGPSINIFSNAVRKARAYEISGQAEIDARAEVIKMLPGIEDGSVTSEQAQTKLATITDGYSRSLAKVDPEAALKFRATIGALGNTVLEKATSIEIKRRKAENQLRLEVDFQNINRELEEVYSRTNWGVGADGKPLTADQVSDAIRDSFIAKATIMGGADQAMPYVQKFPAAIQQAKINAITKYVTNDVGMNDPLLTYNRLRAGDAGELTEVYQSLGQDGKAKVMANLMTVVSNQASIAEKQRKELELKNKDMALDLYEQWLVSKDPAAKRQLQTQMLNLNVLTFEQTKSLLQGDTASPNVIFFLEDQIDNGVIDNSTELLDAAGRNGVSGKQLVELRRRMSTKVSSEAKALHRRLAGIPEGLVQIDPKGEQAKKYNQISTRLETERQKSVAEGKPFDQLATLRQIEREEIEKKNSAAAQAARRQLDVYEKKYGKITTENLPVLKEKANKDKTLAREIPQIERLLKAAEGQD